MKKLPGAARSLKMDTKILRMSQFLGYFPIPVANNTSSTFLKKYVPIVLSLLFILFGFCNIVIFIWHARLDHVHYRAPESSQLLSSETFYFSLLLKGTVHIVTIVFVRLTIFSSRDELSLFYDEFNSLLEQFSQFSPTSENTTDETKFVSVSIRNRFESRLRIEFTAIVLLCLAFIVDMWEGHSSIPASASFSLFHAVIPSTLGYIQVIFPFQLAFFLNWYLEILSSLSTPPFTMLETRLKLYSLLSEHVYSFIRLFGTCLVIDMAHSITRIIICAYSVASFVSEPFPNMRGLLSDFFTVLVYLYLVFMICKKGSQLEIASGDFIKGYENAGKLCGVDHFSRSNPRLSRIWLDTDYFRVNLGLIPPIVGTLLTNLIVLIQFQRADKT
ncbi:hypothetical protein Fcan01_23135 [Folsomia candida]|uniref:Gustatory receptor n=1 Tax=Folsomia candida TaxID=158441 RepID=A0A226DBT6_FOLCA|nr:hypothetical protein Fcan01_23135 [Folsomia candida]